MTDIASLQLSNHVSNPTHRELHDRWVNSKSQVYLFPDDEEEDIRYQAESSSIDDLLRPFYTVLDNYLIPQNGQTTTCLDLGAACGFWVQGMANRYPQCNFTGIDLCPPRSVVATSQIKYMVHDINFGLDDMFGQFDVVHARNLSTGIQRMSTLVSEIGDVLKRRGVALFIEWDFIPYGPNHLPYVSTAPNYAASQRPLPFGCRLKPNEKCPAVVHFLRAVVRASTAAGGHVLAVGNLGAFVQRSGMYDHVDVTDLWIPIVAAGPGDEDREIAQRFRPIFVSFITSCRPLLLEHGDFTSSELSELEDSTRIEIMGCKTPIYIRYVVITAVKNG